MHTSSMWQVRLRVGGHCHVGQAVATSRGLAGSLLERGSRNEGCGSCMRLLMHLHASPLLPLDCQLRDLRPSLRSV